MSLQSATKWDGQTIIRRQTYLETITRANPNKGYMYVVDTRPRVRVKNLCCNKQHSLCVLFVCLFVCLHGYLFICCSITIECHLSRQVGTGGYPD